MKKTKKKIEKVSVTQRGVFLLHFDWLGRLEANKKISRVKRKTLPAYTRMDQISTPQKEVQSDSPIEIDNDKF